MLNASRLRPDLGIVMRFFNIELAQGIQAALPNLTVLSLSALAAPAFVSAAVVPVVVRSFKISGAVMAMARLVVQAGSAVEGRSLAELFDGLPVRSLYHLPPGEKPRYRPKPATILKGGDALTVVAPEETLRRISGRFSSTAHPQPITAAR